MSEQGRKYDGGKLRYDLLPVLALEEVVKGLTFGATKYDDNNWVKVPEGRKRFLAATFRHIEKYRNGVTFDEESGVHHLAAAMDNLMFIVEKDMRGWEDVAEEDISQEELENYVKEFVPTEALPLQSNTEDLWYPPVEEGGNPWIEWNVGLMPRLDPESKVDLLLKCEREDKEVNTANHGEYVAGIQWGNDDSEFDIVAYRVV